jgi:hypothetical protein
MYVHLIHAGNMALVSTGVRWFDIMAIRIRIYSYVRLENTSSHSAN